MADHPGDEAATGELLQVNAAIAVLDKNDHQAVLQEQRTAERQRLELRDFEEAYAREGPSASYVTPTRRSDQSPDYPAVVPNSIPQAELKHLLPPGASVWRGNTTGMWHGHFFAYKRIQEPWIRDDEEGPKRAILRRLWK